MTEVATMEQEMEPTPERPDEGLANRVGHFLGRLFVRGTDGALDAADAAFAKSQERFRSQAIAAGRDPELVEDAAVALEMLHKANTRPVRRQGEVRQVERGSMSTPWRELDYADQARQKRMKQRAARRQRAALARRVQQ